jgi:rSAM/selenodomain-associated transferase 1
VSRRSVGAIVVFAKAPRPGQVKTRLTPPLDPETASGLYAAMLADVLRTTAEIGDALGLAPWLAVHPADARPEMSQRAPGSFRILAQRGETLSERMEWAVREAAAAGAQRILLRGSDSPALDRERIEQALSALDAVDVSLCPDLDGGYSLVGLTRPMPGLFDHAMSTRSVLDDTLANAASIGLTTRRLEPSFDIDTIEDLRHLESLRNGPGAIRCRLTLEYLDDHDLWRLVPRR